MANWCCGNLKIRGNISNVENFLRNTISEGEIEQGDDQIYLKNVWAVFFYGGNMENTVTNEQVFQKLCAVEQLLRAPKVEKGLWDIQDIADYMGLSYGHVYENIITDSRFPAAVDLSSRKGVKAKRLFPKNEVVAFFERHRQKKHRI